jgi:putative oxidoreductase
MSRRVSQVALGLPFIWLGAAAVREPGARVSSLAALNVPKPEVAVRLNGVAMVAGGLALVLDVEPRKAASGLIMALIPTTVAGHPFWKGAPEYRAAQRIHFLKSLGLVGGLAAVREIAQAEPRTSD